MKKENRKVCSSISVSMVVMLLIFLSSCGGGGDEGSPVIKLPRPPGAVAVVSGNDQVTVSWNTNGAVSYNIYMASLSPVTRANGALSSNVTSPYTITALTSNATYYFVVTSVNSVGESRVSSEVSATPSASSSLTVSGTVKYEDKEYGTGGFTGNTSYKAVRYAAVEAVEVSTTVSTSISTVVAIATTSATGGYSLTLPPGGKTIYIRVISTASSPVSATTPMVNVKSTANVLYAVVGANFVASGAAMANIFIPTTSLAAGAFNMLDVFTSGAEFVQSLSTTYPPVLTAFWHIGNTKGTHYCNSGSGSDCSSGAGIYVLSSGGDTDEYDDDVLWHEYGHFIADKYSKDDSLGGVHYLTSNDLDLRLTWSEGWGSFFPAAVKTWLTPALRSSTAAPSVYVDTLGTSGGYFDFGNPGGTPYFYSSNEAAVAKVLIALSANNSNMRAVWDTFASIKTAPSPVNLEVFNDAWNSLGYLGIAATLDERKIKYSADNYEGYNSPSISRKATIGVGENHTLYGSTDIDYIAFDANANQQYTIKTTALKNGADTFITIIKPDLTVVTNDNTNNGNYTNSVPCTLDSNGECHENGYDILGSTKRFIAAATETHYVEVKSSLQRPLSAGKYGEYFLTITSP